ncbi:MAG: PQQ-like beta-propeller repeat protein [Bacteroidales bacterium]|nr:PQQ-like beta-propeller repeat protein [Bacteroidales bacterium]MBK8881496.1 PQQ-like beta-propeller repeat protein [Bacteroidales bacterium]
MKIILISNILLAFVIFSRNPEIYEWRGKGRTGIYPGTNLLKEWPEDGPPEIMRIENIGNGFVSPVFTEERFYISGEVDSMSILFCFDLKGQKLWQTVLGREWTKSCPGSRSAPTIAGDLLYIGNGFGNLYCVKCADGKVLWSKDFEKDFMAKLPLHGHSAAPLVDGDKVFWMPGGKDFNMVALNRFTGKLIWSNKGFGETEGYNSPKLIELPARKIVVTFSSYHLMGFDASSGKLLWSQEQDSYPLDQRTPGHGDTHSNTVLYEDGAIYYAAGDGNCGVKLMLSADGDSIKQVWRNNGFDSYMGGIVKLGNYLYGCGTAKPMLLSINSDNGIIADSLRLGAGAIISADNMLYYYTHKGEMQLLSIDEGKLTKISSFRIKEGTKQHFAHPVINKGILYQRHGNLLLAFDIRKKLPY